jgi:hypothetical protein
MSATKSRARRLETVVMLVPKAKLRGALSFLRIPASTRPSDYTFAVNVDGRESVRDMTFRDLRRARRIEFSLTSRAFSDAIRASSFSEILTRSRARRSCSVNRLRSARFPFATRHACTLPGASTDRAGRHTSVISAHNSHAMIRNTAGEVAASVAALSNPQHPQIQRSRIRPRQR